MNKDRTTIPLTVLRMVRLQNTVDGGSRWRIITNGGELRTRPNSMMVSCMDMSMEGKTFVFTLDGFGRAHDYTEVK